MTRRLRSIPLLAVLIVTLCGTTVMAGGWQYSGVGARAKAMGSAYRALADDWSGVYYNPAGLAFLDANLWNLTAETLSPRPEVKPDFTIDGYGLGYLDGQTRYSKDETMLFGEMALFAKPLEAFPVAFGMAVYQSFDHNADMNLFYLRPAYNDQLQVPERNHNSNLDVINFHPAVAMKFMDDRLAVGFGVPIYRGDVFIDQIRLVENPYSYILNSRPYENFPKLFSIDGYGYGVGFNAGIQYRPSDRFRIGASYTSGVTIKIDGDSRETVFLPYNQGIVNLYNDPQTINDPAQREIRETYSGGAFHADSEFDLDMKLPSEFGFGIAYQVSDKVILASDLVFTRWSEFEDFQVKISDRQINSGLYATWCSLFSDLEIPFGWEDKIKLSFGAEGILSERWTLRGGYMFDQSPIPDEVFSPLFMDTGNKHHLSAGARFNLDESISFDAALEAIFFGERTIDEVVDINGDGYYDNFGGTFKNKTFSSTWALNYRF
ncbi:MAG: outer membrane protein transport protein [candidate division Zixibacteria bacterium]|nr:outer membrane protein transport protein [candidate division Zixibacteria bacterium]